MLFASLFGTVFGTIVPFLFVLSIVIFFHELGHFLVGRLCGVKVDAFSLGFGPEIAAFVDRKGTRWRIGALPLGGYVKFHGDANGASVSDEAAVAAMPEAEKSTTFFAQKVWKRAAIVAAGPIANFILAIVIFTGIYFVHGRGILIPEIDKIMPGSAAEAAGFVLRRHRRLDRRHQDRQFRGHAADCAEPRATRLCLSSSSGTDSRSR